MPNDSRGLWRQAERLEHVVNLLKNASQYADAGEVEEQYDLECRAWSIIQSIQTGLRVHTDLMTQRHKTLPRGLEHWHSIADKCKGK